MNAQIIALILFLIITFFQDRASICLGQSADIPSQQKETNADISHLLKNGDEKFKAGNFRAALDLYAQAKTNAPDDIRVYYRIAKTAETLKLRQPGIEAIQKIISLRPELANDAELNQLKSSLVASSSSGSQVVNPNMRDQMDLESLQLLYEKALKASDGNDQKRLLRQILSDSEFFAKAHPEQTKIWLMRAQAALTLDLEKEGWEAGKRLISTGALDSEDVATRRIMSQLNLNKWLDKEPPHNQFINSLGMKFITIPGLDVKFCVWDVRVNDFSLYALATSDTNREWLNPTYENAYARALVKVSNGHDYPVVNVSFEEAEQFCIWLTKKEQSEGLIGPRQYYRLPEDWEWSVAAGLSESREGRPEDKDGVIKHIFSWGTQWPPPKDAGNYSDLSLYAIGSSRPPINYDDGFPTTSPVGQFAPNKWGLFDMGGNVYQYCIDSYTQHRPRKIVRGSSWLSHLDERALCISRRYPFRDLRFPDQGFRCVINE